MDSNSLWRSASMELKPTPSPLLQDVVPEREIETLLLPEAHVVEPDEEIQVLPTMKQALLFACPVMFALYYAYDQPGALYRPLGWWTIDQLQSQYAAYSLPNLIWPFLVGMLLDAVGVQRVLIPAAILNCLAQSLWWLGVAQQNIVVTLIARVLLGMGGEAEIVSQATIIGQWTMARPGISTKRSGFFQLPAYQCSAVIWAVAGILNRCGTMLNNLLTVRLFLTWGVNASIGMAVLLSAIAILQAIALSRLYSKQEMVSNALISTISSHSDDSVQEKKSTPILFHISQFMSTTKPVYFAILLNSFLIWGTAIPFTAILPDLLQQRHFPNDPVAATTLAALPDLICVLLWLPLSLFMDRWGHRCTFLTLGCFCMTVAHALLAMGTVDAHFPLILIGMGHAATLLASPAFIPYCTSLQYRSTGFGLNTMCANISFVLIPMTIVSHWSTWTSSFAYQWVEAWFTASCLLAVLTALWIQHVEWTMKLGMDGGPRRTVL